MPWTFDGSLVTFGQPCDPPAGASTPIVDALFRSPWRVSAEGSDLIVLLATGEVWRLSAQQAGADLPSQPLPPVTLPEQVPDAYLGVWVLESIFDGLHPLSDLPWFVVEVGGSGSVARGFNGCAHFSGVHLVSTGDAVVVQNEGTARSCLGAGHLSAESLLRIVDGHIMVEPLEGGTLSFVGLSAMAAPTAEQLTGSWRVDTAEPWLRFTANTVEFPNCVVEYAVDFGMISTAGWPADPATCEDADAGTPPTTMTALAQLLAGQNAPVLSDGAGVYLHDEEQQRYYVLTRIVEP